MLSDHLANFFLSFSHMTLIIPIVLLGFIRGDRKLFYHAACIMLFSILVNYALKITFHIPLSPTLGKTGFAFPSGHMQVASVLYGWIAYKKQNLLLYLLMSILLCGIAFGLAHLGYHNYYDITGAVLVAVILIALYNVFQLKKPSLLTPCILVAATFLMGYIYLYHGEIPLYIQIACYTLLWCLVLKVPLLQVLQERKV